MASEQQVKDYLAYWFQLGKKIIVEGKNKQELLPKPVISSDRYSSEFEAIWQQIIKDGGKNWHLEGTTQTIAQLLSADWEIADCPRCSMVVPLKNLGIQLEACPCNDLPNWPNLDIPQPRLPIDNNYYLIKLQQRLREKSK